jgi:hypothetical protein
MSRLTSAQQRQILRSAARQLRTQGARRGGIFSALGRRFGQFGELLGIVVDVLAGDRSPGRRDLESAIELLVNQGFQITPGPLPPTLPTEPPIQAPPVVHPSPIRTRTTPSTRRRRPRAEPWPAEHTVQPLPMRVRGAFESIPEDVEDFSPWILTPQSSNVYAVAYDYGNQILYVQFRADGAPIGYKDSVSICSGKSYKVGIRPNVPGPIYSYGGAGRPVPESLFDEFARTRSPGKVVWDKLRVCGSQYQHQFPYTLTDVPTGQRVPRKATKRGLRVRNVPTVGIGRRTSRQSTLPERIRS